MADDFQGTDNIVLRPGDSKVPYTFTFTPCTTAAANDGSLPYGTSISTVAVTAHDEDGTDVSTQMVQSSSELSNVVTVSLNYPATSGDGKYHLKIIATLDTTTVLEFNFNRIKAKTI